MYMRVHAATAYYWVSALSEFAFEVPYLSYYLFRSLGLGYSFLYMAIFALVLGVFDYPTGGIADRFGRRRVYALGLGLVGCNYLLAAFYVCPAIVVLASFLAGFGAALQSGSLEAWITDKLVETRMTKELDRVFGVGTSVSLAADVLAGIVGSFVTFVGGYWWTIPTAGIAAIVSSCLTLFIMTENWGLEKGEKYAELLKEVARWIFNRKSLLFLGLAQTFFIAGAYAYWETLTPVYSERGIPETFFGLIGSAMHLPAIVSAAYVHRLTRKIGVAKGALILSWTWTGFCFLVPFLVDPSATIALVVVLESVIATRHPIFEFWQNTLIPSKMRATVLSGLSTMGHVGQSFVLFVLSPFVQIQGTIWGLLAAAILTAISNLLLFSVKEDNQKFPNQSVGTNCVK